MTRHCLSLVCLIIINNEQSRTYLHTHTHTPTPIYIPLLTKHVFISITYDDVLIIIVYLLILKSIEFDCVNFLFRF
jgi:hypothetical protein